MKGLRYPPFAKPAPAREIRPAEVAEVLPSIDEYLDELPSIDDFLEVDAPPFATAMYDLPPVDESPPMPQSAEGWAAGTWQSYDWGSVASLNRATAGEMESTWGDADWPEPYSSAPVAHSDHGASPTADEVADALDGIARRIRTGELVIDNLRGMSPEAAMAAALAVLLRMRG